MGQYDAQIERAKKIGVEWTKGAVRYRALFVYLKDDKLAPLRDALRAVLEGLHRGSHAASPQVADEYANALDRVGKGLATIQKEAQEYAAALDVWAHTGPRQGVAQLGKQVQLPDAASEGYAAVAAATQTLLAEVATAVTAAEQAWKQDLQAALEAQRTATESAKKMLAVAKRDAGLAA